MVELLENKKMCKRGRPSVMWPELRKWLMEEYPGVTTSRGLLNKFYEIKALGALVKVKEKGELMEAEYLLQPSRPNQFSGILRELGRLPEEEIAPTAQAIASRKDMLRVTGWRTLLKEVRLGRISETVSENG